MLTVDGDGYEPFSIVAQLIDFSATSIIARVTVSSI